MRFLNRSICVVPVVAAVVLGGLAAADAALPKGAKAVSVAAGGTHTGIDGNLPASGAITGKITIKGSSNPVANLQVYAIDSKGSTVGFPASTDSSGNYALYGLDSGKYRVCVFSPPFLTGADDPFGVVPECAGSNIVASGFQVTKGAKVFNVTRGHATTANFALPKAGGISGAEKDAGGHSLPSLSVNVFRNGKTIGSLASNSAGKYQVNGLPAGSGYTVCFGTLFTSGGPSKTGYLSQCWKNTPWTESSKPPAGANKVTVKAGKDTKNINSSLHPAAAVAGKIVSAVGHKPIQESSIEVFKGTSFVGGSSSKSNGTYRVIGVPSGKVMVCAIGGALSASSSSHFGGRCFKNAKWQGALPPSSATKVSTKAGKTHGNVNIALPAVAGEKFGAIAGKLTGPGGVAIKQAQVQVFHGKSEIGSVETSATGTYLAKGLPAGTGYAVCFNTNGAAPHSGSVPATGYSNVCYKNVKWDAGKLPSGVNTVAVKTGKTTKGVNASVGNGGAIAGTVKLAGGAGSFGVTVEVFSKGVEVRSGSTDSSGNYTVTGLTAMSPGYIVCFDAGFVNFAPSNNLGYLDQCWQNKAWDGNS